LTIGITDDPTAAAAAAAAVAAGDEVIEAGDAKEKWSSAMGASGRRRGATSFAATPRVLEKEEDGKEMSGRVSADRELFFDFGAGISIRGCGGVYPNSRGKQTCGQITFITPTFMP
jgi:hypothetical protein